MLAAGASQSIPRRLMLALVLGAAPLAASAQLMPWIQPSIWPGLTADDMDRMHAAEARLYEGRSIGTIERWRNPDTNNAGAIKLVSRFEAKGMPCRSLDYTIRFAKETTAPSHYAVSWCRVASGEWKIIDLKSRGAS
jgi:surface antigen